jgi:hypothetical protein
MKIHVIGFLNCWSRNVPSTLGNTKAHHGVHRYLALDLICVMINFDIALSWYLNQARVVSIIPLPLYSQENISKFPLCRRLCGLQSQSGCYGDKKLSCPCWELMPTLSILSRNWMFQLTFIHTVILASTQPLIEMSTRNHPGSKCNWHISWQTSRHLWADSLENMGTSMSYNCMGLQGLYRDCFTFYIYH